jgi:hypothetical protein
LSTAALDDKRLNERFAEILEAFGNRPTASIPAAPGGRAELKAAYRFFDNEKPLPKLLPIRSVSVCATVKGTSMMCLPKNEQQIIFIGSFVPATTVLSWTNTKSLAGQFVIP